MVTFSLDVDRQNRKDPRMKTVLPFVSSHHLRARHPHFLWVCSIGCALQEAIQPMLVIQHQQTGHKEAIEPGVDSFGALAQSETQSTARAAQQSDAVEGMYFSRKIRPVRPGSQRLQIL